MCFVRVANDNDRAEIETLLSRSYPALMKESYPPDVLQAALPLMTRANPELLSSGSFYVAEKSGAIVACGGWTFNAPGSQSLVDGLIHARHFAVDPELAYHGLGRLLFNRCVADAAAKGATTIQAFSSLNAERFYRRMGLRTIEYSQIPVTGNVHFPIVVMEGIIASEHRSSHT
jgi:N-acetylglutamate synthase-like GNAT family acetyltransferase